MICQNVKIDTHETGKRIGALLNGKGISVKSTAEKLSVSRQTVYKWICGKSLPTLDNLVQLSILLDTSMDAIVIFKPEDSYIASDYYIRSPMCLCDGIIFR